MNHARAQAPGLRAARGRGAAGGSNRLRAERESLAGSERGSRGRGATAASNGLRAERDSLARSERGFKGARRGGRKQRAASGARFTRAQRAGVQGGPTQAPLAI